jgi:hypothetical protein
MGGSRIFRRAGSDAGVALVAAVLVWVASLVRASDAAPRQAMADPAPPATGWRGDKMPATVGACFHRITVVWAEAALTGQASFWYTGTHGEGASAGTWTFGDRACGRG